jgi:hypothetical protein
LAGAKMVQAHHERATTGRTIGRAIIRTRPEGVEATPWIR